MLDISVSCYKRLTSNIYENVAETKSSISDFLFSFFLETESHYIALAVLEFSM